jgi:MFS family permease
MHAWIPVFFLYFSQYLALEEVIQLSAVYYISVFLLEVPSGYFSDHVGRKPTLLISAVCLIFAHCCFIFGASFEIFALGQFLLAGGIAFQSGTDTAFHYDSLKLNDQESEFEWREARAEKFGLLSLAFSCLLGGALGAIDLKFAYFISLSGALLSIVLISGFTEPTRVSTQIFSFSQTFRLCVSRLGHPVLAWIFAGMVVMYTLEHIPFEFYQPYIQLLDSNIVNLSSGSPSMISGIVIAISMFGGAIGTVFSIKLKTIFGLPGLFLLAAICQLTIIGSMSLWLHSSILFVVFLRNFPMAFLHAPVQAAIAPLVNSQLRATYLSIQGLSQRLLMAFMLFGLSRSIPSDTDLVWSALSSLFTTALLIGISAMIPVVLYGFRIRNRL